MDIRDFPYLPPRSEVTDEVFADAVEDFFRAVPGWTEDLRKIGNFTQLSTNATSATEIANTPGAKTIFVQPEKGYMTGHKITAAHSASVLIEAGVEAYDYVTGRLDFLPTRNVGDAGPYNTWSISLRPDPANVGKQALHVGAEGWKPRQTNPPQVSTIETPVNKVNITALAHDKTTKEYAQFSIYLGSSWDGLTVTGRPVVSNATDAPVFNKTCWGLRAMCIGSGDEIDTGFGETQYSNVVGGDAYVQTIGVETPPISVGGNPGPGKTLVFEEFRNPDDTANDTLDEDGLLLGWVLYINLAQGNDA
jgi:hypothetical protein